MKTAEFNKIANWISENKYDFIMGFIPPEYHESLYMIFESYAKERAIAFAKHTWNPIGGLTNAKWIYDEWKQQSENTKP